MNDLTDDELGTLLKETFTEKEALLDQLPLATKNGRSRAPVLLAAAAVLVVLAGVLYTINRPEPAPPAAHGGSVNVEETGSKDGAIWGTAIVTLASRFQPPHGWSAVEVISQDDWPQAGPQVTAPGSRYSANMPAVRFSAADRVAIESTVRVVAPVTWSRAGVQNAPCPARRPARVVVGPVLTGNQVHLTLQDGCGLARTATYGLRLVNGSWKVVTGIGLEAGNIQCAIATSPPEAC
jgi:hypothetical protein